MLAFGAALGALVLVYAPTRAAHACSCFATSSLLAPAGDEHPVDAPLVFASSCGGSIEAWSISVDGAPAMLVSADSWSGIQTAAITPAPGLGAEVVLSIDCANTFDVPECTDPGARLERVRFTMGAVDTSPPAAVDGVTLELEEGEFNFGCDETTLGLQLRASVDVDPIEPGTWIDIRFLRNGEELRRTTQEIPATGVVEDYHYVDPNEVEGSEVCVSATVVDASGNAAAAEQDCQAIASDDDEKSGCACATDAAGPPSLLVLVVAMVRRRRRPASRDARATRVDPPPVAR
jgi:MYXO-CTERM domain-containing protein